MNILRWFSLLSSKQRAWFFGTAAVMLFIIGFGILLNQSGDPEEVVTVSVEMSIRNIASTLRVSRKALARELNLPLDGSRKKPLSTLV